MGIKEVGVAALKLIGVDPVVIIDKAADIVDKYVQTPDEKAALSLELLKLKQEEQTHAIEQSMQSERLAYADTTSARGIKGIGEYVQAILAFLFTVSFFVLIVFIFFWMKDAGLTAEQTNIVFLVFGAVSGIMVTIVGFYFGSSAGSKGKDDIINKLQQIK